MNDLVSIIIPTYERDVNILKRAIESCISQTYKNIEILVVDDNKEKVYSDKIKEYLKNNENIVYIKNKTNLGAATSRNIGIKESNGKYIAFLDDDDIWYKDKIEKQIECFKNDENIGLVFCNGYKVNGKNNKKEKYFNYDNGISNPTLEDVLTRDCIGTTTQFMVSRKCIEDCGTFDESLPAREDWELTIRIAKKYKICKENDFLFEHYIHKGKQLSKSDIKSLDASILIVNKHKKELDEYKDAKFEQYHEIIKLCFKQFKILMGIKYIVLSYKSSPKIFFKHIKNKIKQKFKHS